MAEQCLSSVTRSKEIRLTQRRICIVNEIYNVIRDPSREVYLVMASGRQDVINFESLLTFPEVAKFSTNTSEIRAAIRYTKGKTGLNNLFGMNSLETGILGSYNYNWVTNATIKQLRRFFSPLTDAKIHTHRSEKYDKLITNFQLTVLAGKVDIPTSDLLKHGVILGHTCESLSRLIARLTPLKHGIKVTHTSDGVQYIAARTWKFEVSDKKDCVDIIYRFGDHDRVYNQDINIKADPWELELNLYDERDPQAFPEQDFKFCYQNLATKYDEFNAIGNRRVVFSLKELMSNTGNFFSEGTQAYLQTRFIMPLSEFVTQAHGVYRKQRISCYSQFDLRQSSWRPLGVDTKYSRSHGESIICVVDDRKEEIINEAIKVLTENQKVFEMPITLFNDSFYKLGSDGSCLVPCSILSTSIHQEFPTNTC